MKTYETAAEAQLKADTLNARYGKIVYTIVELPNGRYRVTTR